MPEITPPKLVLGDLRALEQALDQEIRTIREERPISPITILIENTMLTAYLRQCLAYTGGGHLNLQIITPARLADRFTREMLAREHRPMPQYGDRLLARRVAEERTGTYFRPVAYSSGFAESLRGLFREFHQAGIRPSELSSAIERMPFDGTSKLSDLATLYQQYEEARASFFTPDDIVATVEQVDVGTITELLYSPLIVYGMWSPSGIQFRLFECLIAAGIQLCFFLPRTDTDADVAHEELRTWLLERDAEVHELESVEAGKSSLDHLHRQLFREHDEPAAQDGHVRLLSAPDAPREVREAARTCLKWAEEGIPFHRMAVVYRHTDPYRTLIDQIFQRAGIITYLHSGRPLISEPIGQRLAALINLIGADLPRAAVMEFITETILPEATRDRYGDRENPIHPARWDQITREAGIVHGSEQWLHRLDLLESSKREFIDPDAEVTDEDPLDGDLYEIARLRQFIEDFDAALERVSDEATWTEHLEFLTSLARTYIDGIDPLLEQLATLDDLNDITPRVSFERFRETARFWLLRQNSAAIETGSHGTTPSGQFGRKGVNVFDIGSLRHLRFDAVIILGVAERQFPPPPRQDPLLLDRERAQLNTLGNWCLPLRAQRSEEETMTFTAAVQAARERLQISFPRSEAGSSRSYLPSHFFRAAASALAGRDIEAGQIDTLETAYYTRVPAGSFLPPDDYFPLDAHEYDRCLLERDRELGVQVIGKYRPGIPRGREADEKRRSRQFTEFDGRLDPESARQIAWTAGQGPRAISPSRLETFATCPFRFFLRFVLRLDPVEEPETLERLDALNRGSLIHEILELFLLDLRSRGERPTPERRNEHLLRLYEVAREACERMESTGLVGYPVLWEFDQVALFEDLEEWYDREAADLAGTRLMPETFELRFGWARRKDEGGKGSRDEPYTLDLPGADRDLSFQGRVDRVDIMPDGSRFRVIDYKTGRAGYYKPNTFNGGRSVQLPIYLLATSDLLDIDWQHSEAQYFFPTRRGEFQRVPMTGEWLKEHEDDLIELLSGILQAIENGIFPQFTTVGKQETCRNCDFRELCPINVKRIAQRKQSDEAIVWLRKVIEADSE